MSQAIILNGMALAASILHDIGEELANLHPARPPGVAFVLVGEDDASHTYVKMKQKRAREIGFYSEIVNLNENSTTEQIVAAVDILNHKPEIDGIIVQQPLPKHVDLQTILRCVSPKKDIDGFHPENLGKLLSGDHSGFIPCTPKGIAALLKAYDINLEGKHVVIVGRSLIVGKSLSVLLSRKEPGLNATVTLAHSATQNLRALCHSADVLVCAIGSPHLIQPDWVKQGAVVIDVGISRMPDGTLAGDVDFDSVKSKVKAITPVPKGVGPMTIAMLLKNTYEAFKCN